MPCHRFALSWFLLFSILAPTAALATNGDTLLGVGPTSRAMGGVGVAVPRDAISAIFANPAVMCDASYCDGSQFIMSATVFNPTVRTSITTSDARTFAAKSSTNPSLIPAIGITTPLGPKVRFGFGAYGISGMGVDYRDAGIDLDTGYTGAEGDIYTKLQVMKFAPGIAMSLSPNVSVGAALHLVYGTLDLGQGASDNYTVGGQAGIIARKCRGENCQDFGAILLQKF